MDFTSLAAFLVLTAGSQAPAKADATCCSADQSKAPVKVAQADGYICPITGQVLPCPACCPAKAEDGK